MNHDPKTCELCEQRTARKLTFPPGPWHQEPDRVDFEASGFPCFVNRNGGGNWCGYVGVPNGHPAYLKDYGDVGDIEVHGGLTYASACHGCLCHIPKPGESDDVWWFGFDCAHSGDLTPELADVRLAFPGAYRDLAYVRGETESLARQLAEMRG